MSGWARRGIFNRQDLLRASDGHVEAAAEALGGDVVGRRTIACPSPGKPPSDRSCVVLIGGRGPWIYAYTGSFAAAKAMVHAALEYVAPPAADPAKVGRIWDETIPSGGTLVETYLRSRGITLPVPPCLRFHPELRHGHGSSSPAMVAARQALEPGAFAIHRTWLRRDGRGKASFEDAKRMLGSAKGAAIRLAPVAETLAVGEGIETSLSFMQLAGLPAWAAGSAPALAVLQLPPEVRAVVVAADGDMAGWNAARDAAKRWKAEGRKVQIAHPPHGRDFNDVLRGSHA